MAHHEDVKDGDGVVHHDDVAEAQKLGVDVKEVVAQRINEEDLLQHSRDAINMRSSGGLRIIGIMFVMGCNQAGYGIDWGVIGYVGLKTSTRPPPFSRWPDVWQD